MLSHAEPCMFFKLFQDGPCYSSQTSVHIERRFQFLFLEVTQRLHVPSTMRNLTRNYTVSYRDLDTILQESKDTLPPDLLAQFKRVLNHHNTTNFVGHVIE